jgi:hypothetical protein
MVSAETVLESIAKARSEAVMLERSDLFTIYFL